MASGARASRSTGKIDFMAGSERMLKVHHKNAVVFKSLELKKHYYDNECHRNVSKIQQEIYDVYFQEYLPLRQQAQKTTPLTKLPLIRLHRQRQVTRSTDREGIPSLPSLTGATGSKTKSKGQTDRNMSSFRSLLQGKGTKKGQFSSTACFPQISKTEPLLSAVNCWSRRGSLWPESITCTDTRNSPEIDEKRMEIIRKAVALSSQPAKTPDLKRQKRIRRSFIANLRRQSKQVWEKEIMKRARGKEEGRESLTEEDTMATEPAFPDKCLHWRPSMSKNKIMNEDDSEDGDDEIDFQFVGRSSYASLAGDAAYRALRRRSSRLDPPVIEDPYDFYCPDSSPDLFSILSEEVTGSSFTGSYTTGSESDSDSFYSSQSDF